MNRAGNANPTLTELLNHVKITGFDILADAHDLNLVEHMHFNEFLRELGPTVFASFKKDFGKQNYHGPLRLWQRFFKENESTNCSASLLLPSKDLDVPRERKKV